MGDRDWRPFIYGGLASCVAEFGNYDLCIRWFSTNISPVLPGTFPIDTAKTRLQVQGQKLDVKHAQLKYRGMVDCFLRIGKEEGFGALYAGYVISFKS